MALNYNMNYDVIFRNHVPQNIAQSSREFHLPVLIHKSAFFRNIVYKIDVIIFDVDCPIVGELDVFSAFFVRGC